MAYLTLRDGIKILCEDCGTGETILFSHGLNSSSEKIKKFIDKFKKDYRCVYYDQRGHGASDHSNIHMNIENLGKDLNEIIEQLNLENVTAIGHSMGAAAIFSYVNQFGCGKLKNIVAVDMSPCVRNKDWKGGIAQGTWTDKNFLDDMDRIFDDISAANWYIMKNIMNPKLKDTPAELEPEMLELAGKDTDTLTMASLWFSLFRADQRPAIDKITVPFLYIMPELPLYSMEAVNFYSEHVKNKFYLEKDFPNTTHLILLERPREVAEKIKAFLQSQK